MERRGDQSSRGMTRNCRDRTGSLGGIPDRVRRDSVAGLRLEVGGFIASDPCVTAVDFDLATVREGVVQSGGPLGRCFCLVREIWGERAL